MNCRTFQKNLEDYLQNGLDFAGRFGMERHARQCIHCGKEMTDAQHLSSLVQSLDRVKAPVNFESSVLHEIGVRKLRRSVFPFGRFIAYGFDMPSWRKFALAASTLVAFGLGFIYWQSHQTTHTIQDTSWTSNNSVSPDSDALRDRSDISPEPSSSQADLRFDRLVEGLSIDYQASESDYNEYTGIGPDNLPMIVPLPNTIRMQVGVPSEEYYITNVSH